MKLQEVMQANQIDLNEGQVKGFFLGALSGVKPLEFSHAVTELMGNDTEITAELENILKEQWQHLQKSFAKELASLLDPQVDPTTFLSRAQDRLDFFLTGLSLSGSVRDEELEEVSEELENLVMDLDEYLTDGNVEAERAEELKEDILGAWEEFVSRRIGN